MCAWEMNFVKDQTYLTAANCDLGQGTQSLWDSISSPAKGSWWSLPCLLLWYAAMLQLINLADRNRGLALSVPNSVKGSKSMNMNKTCLYSKSSSP